MQAKNVGAALWRCLFASRCTGTAEQGQSQLGGLLHVQLTLWLGRLMAAVVTVKRDGASVFEALGRNDQQLRESKYSTIAPSVMDAMLMVRSPVS